MPLGTAPKNKQEQIIALEKQLAVVEKSTMAFIATAEKKGMSAEEAENLRQRLGIEKEDEGPAKPEAGPIATLGTSVGNTEGEKTVEQEKSVDKRAIWDELYAQYEIEKAELEKQFDNEIAELEELYQQLLKEEANPTAAKKEEAVATKPEVKSTSEKNENGDIEKEENLGDYLEVYQLLTNHLDHPQETVSPAAVALFEKYKNLVSEIKKAYDQFDSEMKVVFRAGTDKETKLDETIGDFGKWVKQKNSKEKKTGAKQVNLLENDIRDILSSYTWKDLEKLEFKTIEETLDKHGITNQSGAEAIFNILKNGAAAFYEQWKAQAKPIREKIWTEEDEALLKKKKEYGSRVAHLIEEARKKQSETDVSKKPGAASAEKIADPQKYRSEFAQKLIENSKRYLGGQYTPDAGADASIEDRLILSLTLDWKDVALLEAGYPIEHLINHEINRRLETVPTTPDVYMRAEGAKKIKRLVTSLQELCTALNSKPHTVANIEQTQKMNELDHAQIEEFFKDFDYEKGKILEGHDQFIFSDNGKLVYVRNFEGNKIALFTENEANMLTEYALRDISDEITLLQLLDQKYSTGTWTEEKYKEMIENMDDFINHDKK